jgi:hypothetical protein
MAKVDLTNQEVIPDIIADKGKTRQIIFVDTAEFFETWANLIATTIVKLRTKYPDCLVRFEIVVGKHKKSPIRHILLGAARAIENASCKWYADCWCSDRDMQRLMLWQTKLENLAEELGRKE